MRLAFPLIKIKKNDWITNSISIEIVDLNSKTCKTHYYVFICSVNLRILKSI